MFQLRVAQYMRRLFVIYAGTKDMKNIAITIQHIYYCVKYQLYNNFPDFYPLFNPTSHVGQNRSLGDGMSSEYLFNVHVINTL